MKGDTIYVWSVLLDDDSSRLEAFDGFLSKDERERANRFRVERDRNRWVMARCALRLVLSEFCAAAPADIHFSYERKGKPRLTFPETDPKLHFNLSHSGNLAMIAVAPGYPVGIDVEQIRSLPELEDITITHFSRRERETILALAEPQRTQAFFRCWTSKEAFIKLLGDGLSVPLDGFEVAVAPDQPQALVSMDGLAGEPRDWQLHGLQTPDGYVATLAVDAQRTRQSEGPSLVERSLPSPALAACC